MIALLLANLVLQIVFFFSYYEGAKEIADFLNKEGTPESLKKLPSRKQKMDACKRKVFNDRRLINSRMDKYTDKT